MLLTSRLMPSFVHEAPLVLLRECPELAVRVACDVFGLNIPSDSAVRVAEADLTQIVPTEFRADLVIEARDHKPMLGLIFEVQRSIDARKPFVWPSYTANLHARLGCQTCLVVFTHDPQVAIWAGRPIETLQPGSPFTPLVLGPEQVPRILDPDEAARAPELAVLSALAHGHAPDGVEIIATALDAVAGIPEERATLFCDLILGSLPQGMALALEKLMLSQKYEYRSEFARRYFTRGREEGREETLRHSLLTAYRARFGQEPATVAAALDAASVDALERWLPLFVTGTEDEIARATRHEH